MLYHIMALLQFYEIILIRLLKMLIQVANNLKTEIQYLNNLNS